MDGMEPMVDLMENNMLYDCRNKLSTLEPLEYIMAELRIADVFGTRVGNDSKNNMQKNGQKCWRV